MSGVDSVLLVAFGGPTAAHEIRPFLEIVTRGRNIPAERLEEVAHHYELMPGSRSPLADRTFSQARALERTLAHGGSALPVFVGMRNWHPFLHETLAEMAGKGARRALAIILSPLRTEASWERYMRDVAEARRASRGRRKSSSRRRGSSIAASWRRWRIALARRSPRSGTRTNRRRRSCSRPTASRSRWRRPRRTCLI